MNTPEINDGGPAFPCTTGSDGGTMYEGMTLRDWFAGMAMQARIIALGDHTHEGLDMKDALMKVSECHSETAERAYRHADAMIAERNKK